MYFCADPLMDFYCGTPMHFLSGVDRRVLITAILRHPNRAEDNVPQ